MSLGLNESVDLQNSEWWRADKALSLGSGTQVAREKVCVNLTKSGIGIAILSKIMQPTETILIIVYIVQENARRSIKEKN